MKLQLVRFPGNLSKRLLCLIDVHLGEKPVKTVIRVAINVMMNYGNSQSVEENQSQIIKGVAES